MKSNTTKRIISAPRYFFFLILILFIAGFVLRLYRFNGPVADWHSWRQADTSEVSRIFVTDGFDILHPRYLDISNIQTGMDNPKGYRFVEFPLYNIFQAGFYKTVGILTLEEWGRLVSIICSLLSALFLFLFSKKYFGRMVSTFTLSFFLFLPYSIYYSRTILPDTAMVTATLGGIYFFDKYLESDDKSRFILLLVSTIFTACSFLLKPYALFFVLPQVILAYKAYGYKMFIKFELYIHLILAIVPLILWRIWILQYPEGIPASLWLLNGNNIRFHPSFFRWILYERLTKLILGFTGIVLPFVGFFQFKKIINYAIPLSFFVSSVLYVCIFATGNVQHDYYQILIIPTIALFSGLGAAFLWRKGDIIKVFVVFIIISMLYFSGNIVKDYFNINNRALIVAGEKADQILPKDAKVIAPYNGDTTFLYYINRPGWPAFESSIENLKKLGATHMVLISPTEKDKNGFGKKYTIMAESKDYLILKF